MHGHAARAVVGAEQPPAARMHRQMARPRPAGAPAPSTSGRRAVPRSPPPLGSFTAYSVRPSGCTARYDGSATPVIVPAPVTRPQPGRTWRGRCRCRRPRRRCTCRGTGDGDRWSRRGRRRGRGGGGRGCPGGAACGPPARTPDRHHRRPDRRAAGRPSHAAAAPPSAPTKRRGCQPRRRRAHRRSGETSSAPVHCPYLAPVVVVRLVVTATLTRTPGTQKRGAGRGRPRRGAATSRRPRPACPARPPAAYLVRRGGCQGSWSSPSQSPTGFTAPRVSVGARSSASWS